VLELIKNLIGFTIIFYFPEALNIYQGINIPYLFVVYYLIISQLITIYFFFKIKKEEKIAGLETSS
jgi:hypothetical protein